MDKLKIQEEIIEPNFSDDKKMLQELKERMKKEYKERTICRVKVYLLH